MLCTGEKPKFFVTGGQTGADSIPILCYEELGIKLAGYVPNGYKRDDGKGKEIAVKHGLVEGEGGYSWKDKKNEKISDALLCFLVSKPKTGKGSMQTVNLFVAGEHKFVVLEKPDMDVPFMQFGPAGLWHSRFGHKPVLVLWDVDEDNYKKYVRIVGGFFSIHSPKSLMFAGSTEATDPTIASVGAKLIKEVYCDYKEVFCDYNKQI